MTRNDIDFNVIKIKKYLFPDHLKQETVSLMSRDKYNTLFILLTG